MKCGEIGAAAASAVGVMEGGQKTSWHDTIDHRLTVFLALYLCMPKQHGLKLWQKASELISSSLQPLVAARRQEVDVRPPHEQNHAACTRQHDTFEASN